MLPVDSLEEINASSCCLCRQAVLRELLDDGIGFEVNDGSMVMFRFEIGLIDRVENRMGEEIRRKKVPALNLKDLGSIRLFDRYFDG
jgi:hypothetical protein